MNKNTSDKKNKDYKKFYDYNKDENVEKNKRKKESDRRRSKRRRDNYYYDDEEDWKEIKKMYKINLLGQKDVMEFCTAAN